MLYANTDDGSSALWVCDGNGIVVDNISIYGEARATILEQINEHYGTSFTGWSENEIGLRYGDPVPNWSAYEKIELPKTYIAVSLGGSDGAFAFGELKNNSEVIFESTEEGQPLVANTDGIVAGHASSYPGQFTYQWKPKIDAALGINSTSTTIVSTLKDDDNVPNWSNYQKII